MKVLLRLIAVACLLDASSALGDAPCQKCTHDMQVQYRQCLQSGKTQEICTKQELDTAQICVAVCNPKPSGPANAGAPPAKPGD
jgi:hypothetical protein